MKQSEEWKPVPAWPEYEASNLGRIRSTKRGFGTRLLTPKANPCGYLHFRALRSREDQCHITVHRAVCLAFYGPCPQGHEVMHLDGNKLNNALENLRYGTRSENVKARALLGERRRGKKLAIEDVLAIRRRCASGETQRSLARAYGLRPSTVCLIVHGRLWPSLERGE